jgi:hypothetical protein
MNPTEAGIFISFFLIAAVAIISNFAVLIKIYLIGSLTANTTTLILLIHVGTFIQNIAGLPVIYSGNYGLCAFMAFAHYMGGLMNAGATVLLTISYYNYTRDNLQYINQAIAKQGIPLVIAFPWIAVLPISTNSFGASDDGLWYWCSLSYSHDANIWSFVIFYLWVAVALIVATTLFFYILYTTGSYDLEISRRLFYSIGSYIAISIICLTPRAIPRLVRLFIAFNPSVGVEYSWQVGMYIGAIAYSICFFYHERLLIDYERVTHSTSELQDSNLHLSWEEIASAIETQSQFGSSEASQNRALGSSNRNSFYRTSNTSRGNEGLLREPLNPKRKWKTKESNSRYSQTVSRISDTSLVSITQVPFSRLPRSASNEDDSDEDQGGGRADSLDQAFF